MSHFRLLAWKGQKKPSSFESVKTRKNVASQTNFFHKCPFLEKVNSYYDVFLTLDTSLTTQFLHVNLLGE